MTEFSDTPLISVITAVGRQDPWLAEAGKSVAETLDQIGAPGEWLLIGDGVDTAWIESATKSVDVPKVILDTTGVNVGPATTRNRGLAKARGSIIAALDSDDVFIPAGMFALFTDMTTSESDWAAGRCIDITEAGGHLWAGPDVHLDDDVARDGFLRHIVTHGFVPFHCCATLVRADIIRGVGGWDESGTFSRSEDIAMWARISAASAGRWVDSPTMMRRSHAGSITKISQWGQSAESMANEILVTRLDSPGRSYGTIAESLASPEARLRLRTAEPCACHSLLCGHSCERCTTREALRHEFEAAIMSRFELTEYATNADHTVLENLTQRTIHHL